MFYLLRAGREQTLTANRRFTQTALLSRGLGFVKVEM
jgi:hypothetical protein